MRISCLPPCAVVLTLLSATLAAQSSNPTPPAASAPPATESASPTGPAAATAASPPPTLPSGLLLPSLTTVQQALSGLKLEKWKRGTVRDEAGDNVNEVLRDVKSTLPGLMKTADSGPEAVSKTLPLSRNIGALYDVLLRVYEASRVAGPAEQVVEIQQALVSLKNARLALDDRLQQSADAAEKQTSELQVTVQKQALALRSTPPPPPPVACVAPAPKPAVKPRRKPRPAAKPPATPPPATTPAKPSN